MEEFIKNRVWSDLLKTNSVKELSFDAYGDIILWTAYKNEKSPYGWTIAYVHCPEDSQGENTLENLRPVNIKNLHRNNCFCDVDLNALTYQGKNLHQIFKIMGKPPEVNE